jgi:type I restriction enzyme M protein
LVVIECKASVSCHESKDGKSYDKYAVDGALQYATYLKEGFNVTAIAVSGTNDKDKKISTFLWLKKHIAAKEILDKTFLRPSEIESIIKKESKPFIEEDLIKKAIEYNEKLHKYSIPEVERCTLISAVLIALQNKPFLEGYKHYESNKELIDALLSACKSVLRASNLDEEKINTIISEYSKFKTNNDFIILKQKKAMLSQLILQ